MNLLNETHDPALRSWLASANTQGCDFPIQNLPFAVFRRRGSAEAFRGGVAIGDQIVDLAAVLKGIHLQNASLSEDQAQLAQQALEAAAHDQLNALMALGHAASSALRLFLSNSRSFTWASQPSFSAKPL
mgnify:CR=1 FL=1